MKPPIEIPSEFLQEFTLNGKIALEHQYIDSSSLMIDHKMYYKSEVDQYIKEINEKKTFYYDRTDEWLYKALNRYPIKNKKVAVIGSGKPLYESIVLAFGGIPYTIEYHKIVTDDKRLNLFTVEEFNKNPMKFDAVISISSIEHDGLGRYGDPINPNGDINAMKKIGDMLVNDNSLFYISVPVGKDILVWNAHRIYGNIRLKMLFKNWRIVDTFGYPILLKILKRGRQPVFVLRKKVN